MENTTASSPSHDRDAVADTARPTAVSAPSVPDRHDRPEQQALPFEDAADDPIPYALTARARRTVAPDRLPTLRVVGRDRTSRPVDRRSSADDDGDLDDRRDTRAARARALRRAGSTVPDISAQLAVDELIVRAWVGDVAARRAVRHNGGHRGAGAAGDVADDGSRPAEGSCDDRVAFELARASARTDVRRQLDLDGGFGSGLGLVAALADIDPHAVTVATARIELAAGVARWMDAHLPVDASRRRLVLRIGGDVPGDLARHRWAQATGLDADAVSFTRWRGAPTPDAVEGLLRISEPTVAATLAGWCDALLDPSLDDPADLAF